MSSRLSPYIKDEAERLALLKTVHYEAKRVGLQPEIVLSVIHVESRFDHYAVSPAGAQGLMQVMPFWREEIGSSGDNLIDMRTNIRYGCAILSGYLKVENGSLRKALARYNGSVGQLWYPERVFDSWRAHWFVKSV
jgi:soluble lytic murein transglycosylase-like protein